MCKIYLTKKVFIQAAGFTSDFNWKHAKSDGDWVAQKPSKYGIQAYKSIAHSRDTECVVRIRCSDGTYSAAAGKLYIENQSDCNNRPLFLNICIEGLSKQEAMAFECQYRNDPLHNGSHYWPAITTCYVSENGNFNMNWTNLAQNIEKIISMPIDENLDLKDEEVYVEEVVTPPVSKKTKRVEKAIEFAILSVFAWLVGKIFSVLKRKKRKKH